MLGTVLELGRTLRVEGTGQVVKAPMVLEGRLPRARSVLPPVSAWAWNTDPEVGMAC